MPLSPVAAALILVALTLPVSIAAANVALGLLALALLARARTDGRAALDAWRCEPLLAALALYGAAGLASAALSGAPAAALRDAAKDWHRLWSLGLFVAALAMEPAAPLAAALGLSLSAMAALGVFQALTGPTVHGMMTRARGFAHPVVFGEMMAVATLGGAGLLLRPDALGARGRRPAAAFAALAFAALVLSQTRMALFAAALGFAGVVLLEPRARRWAAPALLLTAAVAIAWEFMPDGGRTLSALFKYDPSSPHQARWALWDTAWRMFRDHRWTGVGPGGYRRLFPAYHATPLDGESDWGSAHNLYLHQLAERGLLGVAALLGVIAVLLARALRAARAAADFRALWAAAAALAFLAMALTETSFQNEQFSTLLLLIWAWGTSPQRHRHSH